MFFIYQAILLIFLRNIEGKITNLSENINVTLSIIHFNDFHARYEETEPNGGICRNHTTCIGGYSRLYSLINSMKRLNPESIVLNAGDVFTGTFWYTVGGWNISQKFMNKLPIDATVLGNHEFDDDISGVVSYIKSIKHPIIVSNIVDALEPTMRGIYSKSHVIERGGRKIGIIGVVGENFDRLSKTGRLKFSPESPSVNEEADRLVKEEGVFTNIVLSHAGYPVDKEIAANASKRISLIVGGHSHTLLSSEGSFKIPDKIEGPYPTIVKSKFGRDVAIVQAGSFCRLLGNISITLDGNGELINYSGKPILLDQNVPQDEKINEELIETKKYVEEQGNNTIGFTNIFLDSDCYYKECLLGDVIADAMLYYYTDKLEEKNDFLAILNSAGIRKPIEKGRITINDLYTSTPYRNTVDLGELQGKHIKEIFESTSVFFDGHISKLLQVSGVKLVYNMTRAFGERLSSIKVLSRGSGEKVYRELELDRIYYVAMSSFIRKGGDFFDEIPRYIKNVRKGPEDVRVYEDYLKNNSPIRVIERDRLTFQS
ncbi:unnamed protein product [Phyllotreta striolata]|uniref:Uncharacterized protein n=1 Tax=Phyllotreta striolata TaxID=444603 RepID=A0A9N9TH00_PHYSR|nr:unnamed protein product [Phyllotreta striolata]